MKYSEDMLNEKKKWTEDFSEDPEIKDPYVILVGWEQRQPERGLPSLQTHAVWEPGPRTSPRGPISPGYSNVFT